MTATAHWANGDIVYIAEPENGGGYGVYRYRTAGGKLHRDPAFSGIASRTVAERYAAEYQRRVDGGMTWQEAER